MRLSTQLIQQRGVNAILNQQSKLSRTQMQLATGKKILTPSDDPAGAARMLQLKESIAKTDQLQSNIRSARSRLELEEATLGHATDLLQRARELAVQGVNDTQNGQTRRAIAKEVRQILGEMLGVANSKNANGEYLYAGNQSLTEPISGDPQAGGFSYAGDSNRRLLQIGATRQIADGDPGDSVFGANLADGGSGSVFDALYEFANEMDANTPDATAINDMASHLDRILETRTSVGARLRALDQQHDVNERFAISMRATLSDVEDLDYAEAVGRLNIQSVALQAAQQAYQRVQGLSLFNFL